MSIPVLGTILTYDRSLSAEMRTTLSQPAWLWTHGACLAFLCATAYAIAVVVFRLPFAGLDNGLLFRTALALHVELAVFFWLMMTTAAQWTAGAARSDRFSLNWPRMAIVGTVVLALSPLAGGTPAMADYFPWLTDNPMFALGFVMFCFAVAAAAVSALVNAARDTEKVAWRGVGRSAWPTLAAVATVAADVANGAEGIAEIVWGAGHTLLFAHVAMMCWEWSKLSGSNGRVEGFAASVLAVVSLLMPAIPFIFAPGSADHHLAFTRTMQWLLWPPAAVAAVAAVVASRRSLGTGSCARSALLTSIGLFVGGCMLGALIDGATTLVTAHYHAAVGAVAISRMGMLYLAGPALAPALPTPLAARRQIAVYALGLVLLAGGLAIGSIDAAPRKTSAAETVNKGPWFRTGMSISGVGGLFAMVGSLWLVINLNRPRRTYAQKVP